MTDQNDQLPADDQAADDQAADDTAGHYLHHAEFGQRLARERDREAEQQANDSRARNEGKPVNKRRSIFRRGGD